MNEWAKDVKSVMNQDEFEKKVIELPWETIRKQVDMFQEHNDRRFDDVDRRFNEIDRKFIAIDKKIDDPRVSTDKKIDDLRDDFKRSEDRTDKRFETIQSQLDRIESKIEKKTDRTLNNWYYLIMPIIAVIIGALIGKLNF